jgi:hypothetical protein
MRRAASLPVLLLAACGPVSPERAEQTCLDRAYHAAAPRGEITMGIGSGGHSATHVDLTLSSDYLAGRDPSQVYDACMLQLTGQPPSQPLTTRPDWKG